MKTIYNEYNAVKLDLAHELCDDCRSLPIDKIFKKWEDLDYNIKEISYYLIKEITIQESMIILTKAIEKRFKK